MADMKHNTDGSVELTNNTGKIILTEDELWLLNHDLNLNNMRRDIVAFIRGINNEDWAYCQTKEEILNDSLLLDDLVEDAEYKSIDFQNEDTMLSWLDQYLDY